MTLVMEVPRKLEGELQNMKFVLAKNLYEQRKISLQEASVMTQVETSEFMRVMSQIE